MKQLWEITVSGKVQGVWFRKSTQDQARELGLAGFVRNEPTGEVFIRAVGSPAQLEQLRQWCEQGSPQARVEQVHCEVFPPEPYQDFVIQPA